MSTKKIRTLNTNRQTLKRQKQFDINRNRSETDRKLSQIGKIAVIVSHGEFIGNRNPNIPSKFNVPSNLRLFQITTPTKPAYGVDLHNIVEQLFEIKNKTLVLKRNMKGTDVKPPPIYQSKTEAEKYRYYFPTNIEDKFKITEPGQETSNLKLDFSKSPEPTSIYFKELYYAYANAIIKPKKDDLTLKEVLDKISMKYSDLCDGYDVDDKKYPLDVIQLSCAVGDYTDIENLIIHMEKAFNLSLENNRTECSNTKDLMNIYISTTPTDILNKSNFDDFMVWVKKNYIPTYENHKLMRDKHCKKNIHKRKYSNSKKSNSQGKKQKSLSYKSQK